MTDTNRTDQGQAEHGRVKDGLDAARDKASQAYEATRDKARETARQTVDAVEANPIGVLVGGLALGAIAAAVIPRSQREKELLAPLGKRIGAAATAAAAAAKEAGRGELSNLGLTRDAAKGQARSIFEGLTKAATAASTAATQAAKSEAGTARQG